MYLCLASPSTKGYQCACPEPSHLGDDGRTCQCPDGRVASNGEPLCIDQQKENHPSTPTVRTTTPLLCPNQNDIKCLDQSDQEICVSMKYRCDGVQLCEDGADEAGCPTCSPEMFTCLTGECIDNE